MHVYKKNQHCSTLIYIYIYITNIYHITRLVPLKLHVHEFQYTPENEHGTFTKKDTISSTSIFLGSRPLILPPPTRLVPPPTRLVPDTLPLRTLPWWFINTWMPWPVRPFGFLDFWREGVGYRECGFEHEELSASEKWRNSLFKKRAFWKGNFIQAGYMDRWGYI